MLWQARAEIKAPRHGRIEPSGKVRRHRCGAGQPVGSERSPVSSRRAQPHMSQAVVVPTFSYAGRDEAREHRRPDPHHHAARRAPLANSEHSPAPNQQPPPRPSDDASSNGSLSRCKASYCHRGDAFERQMHVHTRAHRFARAHPRTPARTCRLRKARRCIRAISPLL